MRLIIYFLPFFVLFSACSGHSTAQERFVALKIYHTNDVHAHLKPNGEKRGGLAYLASVLKVIKEQDGDSIILDAGDFYRTGSIPSKVTKDEATAQALALMPYYDVRVAGNNELKVGATRFQSLAQKYEKSPILSSNFVNGKNQSVFPTSIVLSKKGLSIYERLFCSIQQRLIFHSS